MIPKTVSKERLVENWEARNFELSEEDVGKLTGLGCGHRVFDPQYNPRFGKIPVFE